MFKSIAGDEIEIGWQKLKRLLDHFLRDGELNLREPYTNAIKFFNSDLMKAATNGAETNGSATNGHQTDPTGLSKDICRSMLVMLDADKSGKLGLNEFKALLKDIIMWKVSLE